MILAININSDCSVLSTSTAGTCCTIMGCDGRLPSPNSCKPMEIPQGVGHDDLLQRGPTLCSFINNCIIICTTHHQYLCHSSKYMALTSILTIHPYYYRWSCHSIRNDSIRSMSLHRKGIHGNHHQ